MLHHFLGGLGTRAHADDDPFRFRVSDVIEEVILSSRQPGHPVHLLLDDPGYSRVELVTSLPHLEIGVGTHGAHPHMGMLGIESPRPEPVYRLTVHQSRHVLVSDLVYLLDLV